MARFPRRLTSLFLWTALATATLAAVVDTNVHYPDPDYYNFRPPRVGVSYTDNAFGSSIKRITDALATPNADAGGTLTFISGEYSTMTPFNRDNSRILLVHQSYFALYDGSGNFLKNLPIEVNASSEPRWSRSDGNLFYYKYGNQLRLYNVATDAISVVHTFSEYSSISGKGESDICFDGNHFVFAGNNRYVFVYEISTGTKGPVYDTGSRAFDSLYITPNDNVSITWLTAGTSRYNGVELFDRNMNFLRQLTRSGGHMDYTRDSNGDEVLIWTNSNDPLPICDNGIVKVRLSDGSQTCLLSLDWSLAVHISAPDNNGSAFVETYAPGDPIPGTTAWKPYTNELLRVKLDGSQVERLAHHRSRPFNNYNYEPRVSASRDGSMILYASNFGLQSVGYPTDYSDVYLISTTATPPPPPPPPPPAPYRIEENDPSVVYSGTWSESLLSGYSGGRAVRASASGSSATVTFTGTAVSWVGYRDRTSGIARVYIDGSMITTIDTYASSSKAQTVIYQKTGLQAGTHTLKIEVTGSKNKKARGYWIWIDDFEITP